MSQVLRKECSKCKKLQKYSKQTIAKNGRMNEIVSTIKALCTTLETNWQVFILIENFLNITINNISKKDCKT